MNRIVLIGNGFDLAHDLKTSYANFIDWYWKSRILKLKQKTTNVSEDKLCKITLLKERAWSIFIHSHLNKLKESEGRDIYQYLKDHPKAFEIKISEFFDNICKHLETKRWVDIENEYYELLTKYALEKKDETKVKELNGQLQFLQDKLIEYLSSVNKTEVEPIESIKSAIYSQFRPLDISVGGMHSLNEHLKRDLESDDKEIRNKLWKYNYNLYLKDSSDFDEILLKIKDYKEEYAMIQDIKKSSPDTNPTLNYLEFYDCPVELLYPNRIMLLSFNYTKTVKLYCPKSFGIFSINQIHGDLNDPKSVIFGYGDEMDEKYKELEKKNDNLCLGNIKSIKYLESDNYRNVLEFIESEPYQVCIMGHSCGNSDRTLLNTLFEHRNCVSVKPYYYINKKGEDNYLDLVQNISRNFNDKKLMRDRVVNKVYCKPLTEP